MASVNIVLILSVLSLFQLGIGLSHNKTVVCYVQTKAINAYGRGAFHLSDINTNLCSHVIFAFIRLNRNDSLNILPSWYDFFGNNDTFLEFKRKHPNVKYLVAIGGWREGTKNFVRISSFEEKRKSFAKNAAKFARENGFDGLDLCWLFPTKRQGSLHDKINFVQLLKELKTQLHEMNLLLTALIGCNYEIEHGYDVKEISDTVDIMNLRCWAFNGFWSPTIGPNAPMASSDNLNVMHSIERLLELGADPNKLMLGMSIFGWSFLAKNMTNRQDRHVMFGDEFLKLNEYNDNQIINGAYTEDITGVFQYNEICLNLQQSDKWTRYWDNKSSTPYAVHDNYLISYDDAESFAVKVKYAIEKRLGGIMVFPLNAEDFHGDCSKNSTEKGRYVDYPNLRSINEKIEEYLQG